MRALVCTALVLGTANVRAEQPPGNTINPGSLELWRTTDDRGLSALQPQRRRTPSGFLYPFPAEPPRYSMLGSNWSYRGSADLGVLWGAGDEEETRFERYAD